MVEERLREVVSTHHRDWYKRLHTFLLAYRASTPETRRPPALCSGGSYGCPVTYCTGLPQQSAAYDRPRGGYLRWATRHLKVTSDMIKVTYDRLFCGNLGRRQSLVVLSYPNEGKKSPKLQPSWDGPYKMATRLNDVVC
jgi:hypothetical protein